MPARSAAFDAIWSPLPASAKRLGIDIESALYQTVGPVGWFNPTRTHVKPNRADIAKWAAGTSKSEALEPASSSAAATDSQVQARHPVEVDHEEKEEKEDEDHEEPADAVQFIWTSRNNRKGRHELGFTPASNPATAKYLVPESTNSPREILKNFGRMITHYPVWDISWVVAYMFVWGSIVWVINALYVPAFQLK
jgi:hypothetical protein